VTEDDLLAFIAMSIGSVWTLELLMLLKREPHRHWDAESMIRELRGSPVVIEEGLRRLESAGLVGQDSDDRYRFHPASAQLEEIATEIDLLYRTKPTTVIKAITEARTDKLRAFSNAFKFKD
jgi:hypothetical protein